MPHSVLSPARQLQSVAGRYQHALSNGAQSRRLKQRQTRPSAAVTRLQAFDSQPSKVAPSLILSDELDVGTLRNERLARLEAVLFLAKEPLHARKLSKFADLSDGTEAMTLVGRLNDLYDRSARSFRVEEVAGGWQLRTRPQFGSWLRRLQHVPRELRLSAPSLETLAVVAYRQPVVRAEIEDIRGVACGEILRQLMERDLVRVSGRSEELGRPYLYSTTKKFLQSFGLRGLDELPRAEAFRKAISESLSGDSDISTENGDETVAVVFEKDQLIEEIEGEKVQRPAKKAGSKKRAGPPQAIDDDDEWGDEDLDGDEEWEDGDDDEDLDDDDDEEFEYEYEGDDDDEDWEEVDDEDVGDFEDEEDLAADEDDEEEWD